MSITTKGIHHITAIVRNPQDNVEFYEGVLGIRLVKKTVNFDEPGVYHLYYGDEVGSPGTILTFFPVPHAAPGKVGSGQVSRILFGIPKGSQDYWVKRLTDYDISYDLNENGIWFEDADGLPLGFVETSQTMTHDWKGSPITTGYEIQGFYGAVLNSERPEQTSHLLGSIGYHKVGESSHYNIFKADGELAEHLWVEKEVLSPGRGGSGTVHHIAFRTETEADQELWQKKLTNEHGIRVTPIMDRQYFKSVYFPEYGGILFEIATDEPGFTTDENVQNLGDELKLPEWLEPKREQISNQLPKLTRGEVE